MWEAPPTLQFQCKHAVVDPALQPLPDPTPLALGGKPLTLLHVRTAQTPLGKVTLSLPPSLSPSRPTAAHAVERGAETRRHHFNWKLK